MAAAALITGASSGIGTELAKLCLAAGYDVILVARRRDLLERWAHAWGPRASVLPADLSEQDAPHAIFEQLGNRAIEILINNAGFGVRGPFAQTDWNAEARLLQVNVAALAHLTKLVLPGMLARKSGR